MKKTERSGRAEPCFELGQSCFGPVEEEAEEVEEFEAVHPAPGKKRICLEIVAAAEEGAEVGSVAVVGALLVGAEVAS